MQKCTRSCALIIALLSAAIVSCNQTPNDRSWLMGTWKLGYNPAHDDEDILSFKQDGSVEIDTVDGRKVFGKYLLHKDKLSITLITRRQPIDVSFSISPDHHQLRFKNGAYYERKE